MAQMIIVTNLAQCEPLVAILPLSSLKIINEWLYPTSLDIIISKYN